MAGRYFKPLGGTRTEGVTCLRAKFTISDLGNDTYGPDESQQEGIYAGILYGNQDEIGSNPNWTANQAFYLGRFKKQPYAASALTPHYDQNDWYQDILGVEISYGESETPSIDNRLTFELWGNHVKAPLFISGTQYTFAPVFSVRHLSMDGTPAAKEDLLGKTIRLTAWLKNSSA